LTLDASIGGVCKFKLIIRFQQIHNQSNSWCLSLLRQSSLARDVIIYISRLCYDVSVRLSVRLPVCLSVTFVHCGHRVQWIPDIFESLDRWMSLLLTDNASPGSSDGMMPGFLVEERRGYGKIGNCSDITYFTY